MHLEASTKPHVHQKFGIFWTNIASTMACPNFKNRPKNGPGPLGINTFECIYNLFQSIYDIFQCIHDIVISTLPSHSHYYVYVMHTHLYIFFYCPQ
jgi:hypothetical protein